MAKFSNESIKQLRTCHPDLQTIFNEVIKYFDCKVTEGYRGQIAQDKAFAEGKSKLRFPNGKHNDWPSMAVDVYPYPVDMNDTKRFYYFAGFVMGIAERLREEGEITHKVIWGGDWDNDTEIKDNIFNDLVHFQLVK